MNEDWKKLSHSEFAQKYGVRAVGEMIYKDTKRQLEKIDREFKKNNMENIINEVKAERVRQNEKWGIQDHDPIQWIAILTEEVGEAAKEAVDYCFGNGLPEGCNIDNISIEDAKIQFKRITDYRAECIQIAAVAVQMVECIDRELNKEV